MRQKKAFTLMEILLVTSLIAITGVAVFGAFQNGLRLWAKGMKLSHEGDVAIWLDKAGEDFRSAFSFSNIAFKGTGLKVSFPCFVTTQDVSGQIGAVEYRFEPAEKKVYRRQAAYGQAIKGQWGPDQEMATGVEEFELRYYYSGEARSHESAGSLPAGVGIRIRLAGSASDQELRRYFSIPTGGS
jgi:hypothetical protein